VAAGRLSRKSSIKHWHCHAENYWENQQKQIEDKLKEETVTKKKKNVIPPFKLLPGFESANGDDIQKNGSVQMNNISLFLMT
jgi:hypothetical protein